MRTIDIDPAAGELALQRGVEAARAGLCGVAATHLERAAELSPENPDVWLWLAWTANSPDNSIRCLERVLELSPDHPTASAGLAWVRLMSRDARETNLTPARSVTSPIEIPKVSVAVAAIEATAPEPVDATSWVDEPATILTTDATAREPFKMEPTQAVETIQESMTARMQQAAMPVVVDDWSPAQPVELAEVPVEAAAETVAPEPEIEVAKKIEVETPRRSWTELVTRTEPDPVVADSSAWSTTPPPLPTKRPMTEAAIQSRFFDVPAAHSQEMESSVVANTEDADSPIDVEALSQVLDAAVPDESVDDRPLVMVVDDSPTVRKLVSLTLERRGYRVISAYDGVAAIKELGNCRPDLILLDINMPRLDGYRLCKLIKKHEATQTIPVVMLSGKDGMFDKLRGRLVGCSDYITKPFEADALSHKVAKYLISTSTHSL